LKNKILKQVGFTHSKIYDLENYTKESLKWTLDPICRNKKIYRIKIYIGYVNT